MAADRVTVEECHGRAIAHLGGEPISCPAHPGSTYHLIVAERRGGPPGPGMRGWLAGLLERAVEASKGMQADDRRLAHVFGLVVAEAGLDEAAEDRMMRRSGAAGVVARLVRRQSRKLGKRPAADSEPPILGGDLRGIRFKGEG